MSVEQIINIPASREVTIQIPASFKNREKVKLIIDEIDNTLENKISLMQRAAEDKDFLFDLEEVNKDFEFADNNVEE